MAAVMASAAFGAICGSSIATAATITSVALPEMQRHGYSGRLSTGTLAAGGTLGILIPPSVPLVIYAILTEQNIAKLFAAATIPGVIAMVGYMIAIADVCAHLFPGHAPEHDDWICPRMTLEGVLMQCAADRRHLPHRVRWHLRRPVHAHRRRRRGRRRPPSWRHCCKRELTLKKIAHCFYCRRPSASAMIFLIFIGADMMNTALALTQVPGAAGQR